MTFEQWWKNRRKYVNSHNSKIVARTAWQMSQVNWEPIETAPKSKNILLTEGGDVYMGYWEKRPNYWGEVGWADAEVRYLTWYTESPLKPTHWMPLPEPPKEEEEEEWY